MSVKLPIGTNGFRGYSYTSETDPSILAYPSQNCLIQDDGSVYSRMGFAEEFSIGVDGSAATTFYHKTYDIAFFALGTKVYCRDFTTNTTYDTGITLTAGKTTRITEFFGDVYLCNTTDGIIRICCFRLNDAAATVGDATFTVDVSGLGRMSAFGDTSGNFRINGTNESVASFVVSTGVVTHSTTLSKSYPDNALVLFIDNSYSSLDEPSKMVFWKNRMHYMGFPSATNADQPNNTVITGQFVIGQTGAAGIELIMDITFGTGGSTKITVGTGGKLTNILGVKDQLYFFLEDATYAASSADITTSGSAIGATNPDLKDELHGCLNEDCATVMGDNAVTYVTNDKRIMRIPIDTVTGAALSHPDESFDVPIRDHLKNMVKDQTGALVYHYRGGRQTIYQLNISGQWYWFIYDHNITFDPNAPNGSWQPPQSIAPVKGFFERNGVLYGTDASDDTVYSYFTTFTDNLNAIPVTIATGNFNIGRAMLDRAQVQGLINQPSQINIRCYVTNNTVGRRSGTAKVISGSDFSYSADFSIGSVAVGDGGVASETTEVAFWDKDFGVFPSQGNRAQLILQNEQDGGFMSLNSFALTGKQYPSSFQKAL